jgi:NAD(P)-dependent dehydrogenase (short-subunit alcohol dehydrogenase family)
MEKIFQNNIFKDKIMVLTGASSGINYQIARRFAEFGAKVNIIARRQNKIDEAVQRIVDDGGSAEGYSADVREYKDIKTIFSKIAEKHGSVDILLAGAAHNSPTMVKDMKPRNFGHVVDIDLKGVYHTIYASYEYLTKPGASIIAISAVQASMPMRTQAAVCAAKAGIEMLIKNMALEWGPEGIRLNAIAPGPIEGTEGMDRLSPSMPDKDALTGRLPLQCYGSKDDVAGCAMFLSSPLAKFITGTVLTVDGGSRLVGDGDGILYK